MGYVEINACEQQLLPPFGYRWLGCWSLGLSLPQGVPWVRKLSGWLLPLAARALATAPWILGIVLWALPLGRTQPGIGVLLALGGAGGVQDEMNSRGSPGAAPQISQTWGHGWCVAVTRAFTPGDASSLLGWSPPERSSG